MQNRQVFEGTVGMLDYDSIAGAVAKIRQNDAAGREQILAAVCWAAFACPQAITPIFDALAKAWLGAEKGLVPAMAAEPDNLPSAPLESSFWQAFWSVIDQKNFDAISITAAVAGLGGAVHSSMLALSEAAAAQHPGASAAKTRPVPGHTDLKALATTPKNSLGYTLHQMVVDNGYDLEVLDRDAIQLSELPPSLRYLNVRILQMHDVWHLAAGYSTSGSHEIAISAFQLAQFGHNYSAMFLAVVLMKSHVGTPRSFTLLLQLILEAWRHGRQVPAMMEIEWEAEWQHSIEDIRKRYDIKPYRSVLPANMLEVFGGGSWWQRLRLGWQLSRLLKQLKSGQNPYYA